jgi:hypothetical protein
MTPTAKADVSFWTAGSWAWTAGVMKRSFIKREIGFGAMKRGAERVDGFTSF